MAVSYSQFEQVVLQVTVVLTGLLLVLPELFELQKLNSPFRRAHKKFCLKVAFLEQTANIPGAVCYTQSLIATLPEMLKVGSGPMSGCSKPLLASWSEISLYLIPLCPGLFY
jgi:hypothetical protein